MHDILSVILVFYYIFLVITAIYLLLDNREPSSTIAWLILFIVFPILGFIFYLFCGRSIRRSNASLRHQFIEGHIADLLQPLMRRQQEARQHLESKWTTAYKKQLMDLVYKTSSALLATNNRLRLFHHGKEKFDAFCDDLNAARKFIHLEYFIWRSDALGERVKEILIRKAKEGVPVRVLYDSFGGIRLKRSYVKELRDAGVEMYPYFNFLKPFKLHTLNFRNHRKLAVIDGRIGYNGGLNIGQEYIDGGRFKFWRDTHLRVEGEAVALYESIFAIDWYNTTKKELFDKNLYQFDFDFEERAPLQVSTSGPDSEWESIKQLYFAMIKSAHKNLYLQSAYFVPDASIFMALKSAALSGIDVKIMVTGIVDHWLPYWSAFTYFEDLLKAGVRIFHYNKGMMHAKTISIDSQVCSVGTANLDIRSFSLNYETNTLIYDERIAQEIEAQFMEDLKECREFTLADSAKLKPWVRVRNSLARLFAPLL